MNQESDPAEISAPGPEQPSRLLQDVIRLSAADVASLDYFADVLGRVLSCLAAPAGFVWSRSADGAFERVCRLNPGGVSPELAGKELAHHDQLIRLGLGATEASFYPCSTPESPEEVPIFPFGMFLVPILVDQRCEALLEIWLGAEREPQAVPGMLQILARIADLSAAFLLRHRERMRSGHEQVWERIEAFSRRVHNSLHPTEVAFLVANEGRQLAGCDRLSVALRQGRRAKIKAVSGVEKVDPRSNLVRRMRRLSDRVLSWGEPLVYSGQADRTLPPSILRELDAYLEECHSKVLVVLPLLTETDREKKRPPRAALVCECFEATTPSEQLRERLDVIGRHAATALTNAVAHQGVPLRFLWWPLAKVQEGLGGKAKAIIAAVTALVLIAVCALIFVPYPLKMDAKGQLLPEQRRWVFSPVDGTVVRFEEGVEPGAEVAEHQALVLMYDVQLESKLLQLRQEMTAAQNDAAALAKQLTATTTEADRLRLSAEKKQKESLRDRKYWELKMLRERTDADDARPGYFWLRAPLAGTVLNWDFRENLTNRQVRPSEPLLRVGDKHRDWEIELKIPQKHIGQIVRAFPTNDLKAELDVDLLVTSEPTRIYKGKLSRIKIAGEANLSKEEAGEAEPIVLASIRIDGPGIAPEDRIPAALLVSGTEVHAKIRCGDRAMGYSLFYGVWEFAFERIVFWF